LVRVHLNVKFSLLSFLLGHLHVFHHNYFQFLWLLLQDLTNGGKINIPIINYFLTPLMFGSNSITSITIFVYILHLHFVGQLPLSLFPFSSHFYKVSHGFMTGWQRGNTTIPSQFLCELNSRYGVTKTLQEERWLVLAPFFLP
jgi:hypothetical protein